MLRNMNTSAGETTGGDGSDEVLHFVVPVKADLPAPSPLNGSAMGRVEGTDPDNGKGYIINPSKSAWVSFTHLE
jgi:hypothetical protein